MTAMTDDALTDDAVYDEALRLLSEGSVQRHFEPYVDIDWDAPEFAVVPGDRRWILSESTDPLGRHPWYQALSEDRKIEIGMWRQANVAKVGLQFEQLLIAGLVQYVSRRPNGSAESRYCTHEVIEECNHTLMFQEMVNRMGVDVPGGPRWFLRIMPLLALIGPSLPVLFFTGILAGEEPIDHLQKGILRSGEDIHPIMAAVMRIHVAEEARHISFAHTFLARHVPRLSRPRRWAMSVTFPLVMRLLCDVIACPPREFWTRFDIPDQVRSDLFWDSPESQHALRSYFADVRALAERTGLMNPVSRRVWKLVSIDGPPSRYRSEPDRRRPDAPRAAA